MRNDWYLEKHSRWRIWEPRCRQRKFLNGYLGAIRGQLYKESNISRLEPHGLSKQRNTFLLKWWIIWGQMWHFKLTALITTLESDHRLTFPSAQQWGQKACSFSKVILVRDNRIRWLPITSVVSIKNPDAEPQPFIRGIPSAIATFKWSFCTECNSPWFGSVSLNNKTRPRSHLRLEETFERQVRVSNNLDTLLTLKHGSFKPRRL